MDNRHSQPLFSEVGPQPARVKRQVSRRAMLKLGALGVAASTLGILEAQAWLPRRIAHAAPARLPDIQFDISNYLAPARTIDGVLFRFGPVHTLFVTARLTRTPTSPISRFFPRPSIRLKMPMPLVQSWHFQLRVLWPALLSSIAT